MKDSDELLYVSETENSNSEENVRTTNHILSHLHNLFTCQKKKDANKLGDKKKSPNLSSETYDEYLAALRRMGKNFQNETDDDEAIVTARERYRRRSRQNALIDEAVQALKDDNYELTNSTILATMVPDEVIYDCKSEDVREYDVALMFIDVSGFSDLCEKYNAMSEGGPSSLTVVLNSYMAPMIQEILSNNGDLLKFAGDAFISMWKETVKFSMHDISHAALDCALAIQKNYGSQKTEVGVDLKVKIAISAGHAFFSLIGDSNCHYIIVGQPVWDVKAAEQIALPGDVIVSPSLWQFANQGEYYTACPDQYHTKVLGVGPLWKRVENIGVLDINASNEKIQDFNTISIILNYEEINSEKYIEMRTQRYSLRQSVEFAVRSRLTSTLRNYVTEPVRHALELAEPLEYLTEMRHVVIVIVNATAYDMGMRELIMLVDEVFRLLNWEAQAVHGVLNKVSLFDKGITYLVIFGLRGYKSEDEASTALLFSLQIHNKLQKFRHMASVSIGVASGPTYCGVVGHKLRREYTVIGSAVNKAARLMMHYENMVSCDKDTFLRSNMDEDYFTLLQPKLFKGISKPGPIYKVEKPKLWKQKNNLYKSPLLGHNQELKLYKKLLRIALQARKSLQDIGVEVDDLRSMALIGPNMVGKKRLISEFLHITPKYVPVSKIILNEDHKKVPFKLIQLIFHEPLGVKHTSTYEAEIASRINISELNVVARHAFNVIFNCNFRLPATFKYSGDFGNDCYVNKAFQDLCLKVFLTTCVTTVTNTHYVDDGSWRILPIILSSKTVFIVMDIIPATIKKSEVVKFLSCKYLMKVEVHPLERWYHAALACQLLDVLAIPADLEKVIQSRSKGMPGWIRNFLVALRQSNHLRITTMTRKDAVEQGTIIPPLHMIYRDGTVPGNTDKNTFIEESGWSIFKSSYKDSKTNLLNPKNVNKSMYHQIKVAVLEENYTFEDVTFDLTMDSIIMNIYDSLTPFEKMLIKCCAVLNDAFTRRMLEHLLQSDSRRKVALAIAKLHEIRVLRCEGGDFTREANPALVSPAPAHLSELPVYAKECCFCIGCEIPPDCKDLPPHAFCGYMRFRKPVFRTTMYRLLTEAQKRAFHMRAAVFLERYAHRCISCGGGCFNKILGQRYSDGLCNTPMMLQNYLMLKYSQENTAGNNHPSILKPSSREDFIHQSVPSFHMFSEIKPLSTTSSRHSNRWSQDNVTEVDLKMVGVKSFSSLDITNCECIAILNATYLQIIPHCKGAGEYEKLIEAYLEYAALSIHCHNIPQAMRLLSEVENFVKGAEYKRVQKDDELCKWLLKYLLGRIYSLRGYIYLKSDDKSQAHTCLHKAMEYYCCPFPTSNQMVKLSTVFVRLKQTLILNMAPSLFIGHATGINAMYAEDVAHTLNHLYNLFMNLKEMDKARLAAKWSLNLALSSDSNFSLLCLCYANQMTISRIDCNWSKCTKLEKQSMELCRRKRTHLEVIELDAVCTLYSSIFFLYAWHKPPKESMELGLRILPLLIKSWQGGPILLWLPRLFFNQLRVGDAIAVVKELVNVTDFNHLMAETWYYAAALSVQLDTGFYVEPFLVCEHFFMQHRDELLHMETPCAINTFIAAMWLMCLRTSSWERAVMWYDKIESILSENLHEDRLNTDMTLRLVEGLIIKLVKEIDNHNVDAVRHLELVIKRLLKEIALLVKQMPPYVARYHLMTAYFDYVRHKEHKAFKKILKSYHEAKRNENLIILIWCEHTQKHWRGNLNPLLVEYWRDHTEKGCLLHYKDMNQELKSYVPYTLPLPKTI